VQEQVYSDGIAQISIIGGTVRLDLVALSPTEKDAKGQPVAVFCQRVVMSLEGFMQSAGKMQEAAQAVLKLTQRPRDGQPTQTVEEPAAGAPMPAGNPAMDPASAVQKRPFP